MTRENGSILNCAAMAKPHLHLHYSLLVLSTVSNYHYHFKHTVSRFNYECVQRSRQVTLFCIFGTEITESFIITNWIFFKPYTDNCFIFRMLALLFLSCCWEHTDWLIQSCRSAQRYAGYLLWNTYHLWIHGIVPSPSLNVSFTGKVWFGAGKLPYKLESYDLYQETEPNDK